MAASKSTSSFFCGGWTGLARGAGARQQTTTNLVVLVGLVERLGKPRGQLNESFVVMLIQNLRAAVGHTGERHRRETKHRHLWPPTLRYVGGRQHENTLARPRAGGGSNGATLVSVDWYRTIVDPATKCFCGGSRDSECMYRPRGESAGHRNDGVDARLLAAEDVRECAWFLAGGTKSPLVVRKLLPSTMRGDAFGDMALGSCSLGVDGSDGIDRCESLPQDTEFMRAAPIAGTPGDACASKCCFVSSTPPAREEAWRLLATPVS